MCERVPPSSPPELLWNYRRTIGISSGDVNMLTTADQVTHKAHHTSENFFDCRDDHPDVKVTVALSH